MQKIFSSPKWLFHWFREMLGHSSHKHKNVKKPALKTFRKIKKRESESREWVERRNIACFKVTNRKLKWHSKHDDFGAEKKKQFRFVISSFTSDTFYDFCEIEIFAVFCFFRVDETFWWVFSGGNQIFSLTRITFEVKTAEYMDKRKKTRKE